MFHCVGVSFNSFRFGFDFLFVGFSMSFGDFGVSLGVDFGFFHLCLGDVLVTFGNCFNNSRRYWRSSSSLGGHCRSLCKNRRSKQTGDQGSE